MKEYQFGMFGMDLKSKCTESDRPWVVPSWLGNSKPLWARARAMIGKMHSTGEKSRVRQKQGLLLVKTILVAKELQVLS